MGQGRQFGDRHQDTGLVVGPHHADERDVIADQRLRCFEIDAPLRVHGNQIDRMALRLQAGGQGERPRVLDRAS